MKKTLQYLSACIVLIIFSMPKIIEAHSLCHPSLWPSNAFDLTPVSESQLQAIQSLRKSADESLSTVPHPQIFLGSAGKINKKDPVYIASNLAFPDADRAAVLALAYTLLDNPDYFDKAQNILLSWAKVNQPSGHPIDETRLEGMLWAYDLIACQITKENQVIIEAWFEKMRTKKLAWPFGSITRFNNHRINQMKMILLLDKVLHHSVDWQQHSAEMQKLAEWNIDPRTGESIDYRQRDALHYHNYDLQAWLEINLITGCCQQPVFQAFNFLKNRLLTHQIGGEFLHSTAKIDALRAANGFTYAKINGTFDVDKAAPTIATYYTMVSDEPNPELWAIVKNSKPSLWLEFVNDRRVFW
jgi:hypothetical protein